MFHPARQHGDPLTRGGRSLGLKVHPRAARGCEPRRKVGEVLFSRVIAPIPPALQPLFERPHLLRPAGHLSMGRLLREAM